MFFSTSSVTPALVCKQGVLDLKKLIKLLWILCKINMNVLLLSSFSSVLQMLFSPPVYLLGIRCCLCMYFECSGISLREVYCCSECYSVVHNALALFSYAASHYVLNAPKYIFMSAFGWFFFWFLFVLLPSAASVGSLKYAQKQNSFAPHICMVGCPF